MTHKTTWQQVQRSPQQIPLLSRPLAANIRRLLIFLCFVGALLFMSYDRLIMPPLPAGYHTTDARVYAMMRRGTPMNPTYSLELHYDAAPQATRRDMVVSRRPVDLQTFAMLEIGDTVQVIYSTDDVFDWQLRTNEGQTRNLMIGVLLLCGGVFLIFLPQIVRFALLQDDFGY